MPAHNGVAQRIAEYVRQHPGCTRGELLRAVGLDVRNRMPAYCRKIGLIYVAGPWCWQRYYPTPEQAWQEDARLRAEAVEHRKLAKRQQWKRKNVKQRAKRAAAGQNNRNTRPTCHVRLDPGARIALDCRYTPATPMRGRWEAAAAPAVVDPAQARPWALALARQMEGK